ncbi:hypothetical protein [Clostridium thermarum]|uniref:hypothetical protein n=1 Tax=Clostridium thermarum TaxID=1716543 RepID=UPI00111DB5B2|nr:hypothetical protein [Clostridium thermarum]
MMCILMVSILFTGCIPGDGSYSSSDPANFLSGIWHGWIAPISLVGSLFNSKLRIYETINTGWWYDFGFYIAIISGFGGISLSRKKKKSKQ